MNNGADFEALWCLAVLFGLMFLILLMALLVKGYSVFRSKKDYIVMEIERASESERDYWKRELTDLYISYIPYVGESIVKIRKKRRDQSKDK